MDRHNEDRAHEPTRDRGVPRGDHVPDPTRDDTELGDVERSDVEPNPPHTTTGNVTAPKFGSAGSGGLELEPGPPRP
jgi:hypothetical protein